jgi:hypothetical protein
MCSKMRYGLLLSSVVSALALPSVACDDGGFTTASYSQISVSPENVVFASLQRGESSTDSLVKIQQAGDRPLTLNRVYLASEAEDGTLTEVSGCDRITEGIDPSVILQPSVLPTCSVVITERPATLPMTLVSGEFQQVVLTYRPLLNESPTDLRLVVESNAYQDYQRVVELSVSESRPELGGLSAIEFSGSGRSAENYLVRNIGSGGLVVTNVVISPLPDYPPYVDPTTGVEALEFSVDGTCPLPCTLDSSNNNYTTLRVTYDPKDEGIDKATLKVEASTLAGEPLAPLSVMLTSEVTPLVLDVSPSPLTFEHRPNATVTKTLNFRNTALRPINVLELSVEGSDAFRLSSMETSSFQIVGGDTRIVTVIYEAPGEPQRGALVVRTDAENAEGGLLRVPLVADGAGGLSLLSASAGTLSFNGVAGGMSSEQVVTLSSGGTDPVALTGYALDDPDGVFAVSGDAAGSLAVGATRELRVTFTRPEGEAVPNTYQGTLSVESDSAGGVVNITLIANP